jgi:predicted permease
MRNLASAPQTFVRSLADNLGRDVRYGWRTLRRSPGFTTAITLSLAIVIGANTALFGLVDAMFLRRLPLPNAEQLASVKPVSDGRPMSVTYAQYQMVKASAAMPPVEAYRFEGVTAVTQTGEHTDLWIDLVTGGYFQLLGVKPLIGRLLDAQDERAAAPVAVVSEAFWTRYLGRSPDVLGRPIHLNDMTFTVVGVTPARFAGIHFARRFQIAIPFTLSPMGYPDARRLAATMVARLDDRRARASQVASIDGAFRACCLDAATPNTQRDARASEVHVVAVDDPPIHETMSRSDRAGTGIHVVVTDASRGVTSGVDFRDRYRSALVATMAGVLLLLLIACANVATLLLARGESREREFAVRRSLGAGAARIRVQLFIEGLELAFGGALLGFVFAALGTKLLLHVLPRSASPLGDVIAWRSSGVVIAFTAGIMIVCAVGTSLWPARRAGREELVASLAGARRPIVSSWGADRVLVVAQIALAIVLSTAATLFVPTVRNMTRTEGGYRTRNVLLASLNTRQLVDDKQAMQIASADVLRDVAALAGVDGAALTFNAPVLQDGLMQTRVTLPGSTEPAMVTARMNLTSTGFFSATGIGLVSGRDFSASDDALAPPVVIVSQGFERRYYGRPFGVGCSRRYAEPLGSTHGIDRWCRA